MFDRFLFLLLEIFFSFLSMKDCCFGWIGSCPQMLIWFSFFLLLQLDDEEKVVPASLYQ